MFDLRNIGSVSIDRDTVYHDEKNKITVCFVLLFDECVSNFVTQFNVFHGSPEELVFQANDWKLVELFLRSYSR